ncbi:hypothetical protein J6Z19_02855 [bacterium]|nr:hypothetical protein [bacterium]
MRKKLIFIVLLALLLPFAVAAKEIGPNVSKYRGQELKWEDGAYGYHVMFKSLLDNKQPEPQGYENNPQGDTCKSSSTYTLDMSHIPGDAIVEDAFLIWTAAQPIAKKDDITDKEVTLSFVSSLSNNSIAKNITGKKAYKISEAGTVDFEFDAFIDTENPDKRWYTYRVKVTDFFKEIQEQARAAANAGEAIYDGYSLLGDYTLAGLECSEDSVYKDRTDMVADWSIVLIYSSVEISPKKIYMYDGFKSYWHERSEINVTGFVFPIKPEIRVTLASHEGDPGLWDLTHDPIIPEGIEVLGEPIVPDQWLLLSNECNPAAFGTNGFVNLDYTEIFNSISSVYGYQDSIPTCIGGTPPVFNTEEIEYGIEVDTFLMDASADDKFADHFHKGGQKISFKIGANQDSVITNYMIVSVDTKAPQFDIPGQPEKVACTPANKFDAYSLEGNWCQGSLEHTFALRIQNWGTDSTKNISVRDSIPDGMEYVPGSTEYATSFEVKDNKKIAKRWTPIPDSNGFPLENGFKVADSLNFCPENSDYLSCNDLIVVRFRAKVKSDAPKNQVIENIATYNTPGVNDYKTNLGIPVKLRIRSAGCVTSQDAVDLSECGGVGAAACTKNEDCAEGYICQKETGECTEDPSFVKCKDSEITASIGKNSPSSEVVLIKNPQADLVIGQLELAGSGENCYLNLDQIKLKIDVKDSKITLSNFKMYNDANGNGTVDAGDPLLGSTDVLTSGYATFSASNPANRIWSNKKNNILFTLDANYSSETIENSATFIAKIESGAVVLSDGGTPKINGLPIDFAKFQFEPDRGFIIKPGPHDPEVPAKSDMNRFQDVLQISMTAKGSDDILKSITIKPTKKSVELGKGIKRIAVYEDTDNDGKGDVEIASTTKFDGLQKHTFSIDNFEFQANTEKFITIRAEPALSDGDVFQIEVSAKVKNLDIVASGSVTSKPYEYSCDPRVEECGDEGGCSVVAPEENSPAAIYAALTALLALLSAFAFRMRKN